MTERRAASASPKYAFAFLDETGTLGGARDPFFAVGLLRCTDPYKLARPMQRIRDRQHFYDDRRSGRLRRAWSCPRRTADKVASEPKKTLTRSDHQRQLLLRDLVPLDLGSIRRGETLWVIADEYSTPPGETFEENVRDYVNLKLRRTAVAGVCRMRSSGVDLLQLIDLILGAVVYEHKAKTGIVDLAAYKPKVKLLNHVKKRAGVKTFIGGYRDARLNIAEYSERP